MNKKSSLGYNKRCALHANITNTITKIGEKKFETRVKTWLQFRLYASDGELISLSLDTKQQNQNNSKNTIIIIIIIIIITIINSNNKAYRYPCQLLFYFHLIKKYCIYIEAIPTHYKIKSLAQCSGSKIIESNECSSWIPFSRCIKYIVCNMNKNYCSNSKSKGKARIMCVCRFARSNQLC